MVYFNKEKRFTKLNEESKILLLTDAIIRETQFYLYLNIKNL